MSSAAKAIAALREPDASFIRVPNTVRQAIADVIEQQQQRIETLETAVQRIRYTEGISRAVEKLALEALRGTDQ